MKKRSLQKLMAMLLCLSMVLSLLPAGALATEQGENPSGVLPTTSSENSEEVKDTQVEEESKEEDVATDDSEEPPVEEALDVSEPKAGTGQEDGALADTWTQDALTRVSGSVEPEIIDGKLYLKAVTANGNNGGAFTTTPPAMFINEKLDTALAAAGDGEKTLSFTLTTGAAADNICFGIYLNYASPTSEKKEVNGMFVGYDNYTKWFSQHYGGNNTYPSISGLPNLVKNTTYTVELKWTDSEVTSIKVNNIVGTIANSGNNFSDVTTAIGVIDKVGIKVGKDTQSRQTTDVYLSDVHYTGQASSAIVYEVSGTVTNSVDGTPIADATVTVTPSNKTAITSADGNYAITGLVAGTYTVNVAKADHWSPAAVELTISGDTSGNDLTLTPYIYNNVSGVVATEEGTPLKNAVVEAGGKKAATDAEGKYTLTGVLGGEQTLTVSLDGYDDAAQEITVSKIADTPLTGVETKLTPDSTTTTLSTTDMDVRVDLGFPRVVKYTLKGDNEGKVMFGQTEKLNTLTINGINIVPVVTSEVAADKSKITYTMTATGANIDCVVHAELVAEGKTLTFNINRIDNNLDVLTHPVESISIPNHSLVSVRSNQAGANLAGAKMSTNTTTSGDVFYDNTQFASANNGYFYAFISTDTLSAGLASNSEVGTSGAGGDNYRVRSTAENRGEYTSLGLSSALWYYDRTLLSSGFDPGSPTSSATDNAALSDEQKVMGPTELPLYAKVVITGDENGDDVINWQDGAIAARDTIVHIPFKGDEVRDLVGIRIAMNFASQATNPFLTTLDNVKRVAMSTDGLGQTVLLKGYASEGHDSGHPDYGNIGSRMGGTKDFNTLMTEGKKYGASFGIHINASEFYPEAKAFSSKMVRRYDNGGLDYRWNWLDQGIAINGQYDLASGSRAARFADLKRQVGDNLDFIYVDVWGNLTSGSENAWQTRKLSKQLTDNGWRVAHEWSWANEWESTLQHWTTDYPYGGYSAKGINSMVERFLLNSYKDSWVSDFPSYGGAAMAPLLGGPIMQGFEGWQGDAEYDQTIDNMFNQMLPYKFLQHYNIMSWENADNTVMLRYPEGTKAWTPDKSATLQSEDGTDKISVTRDGTTFGTPEEQMAYRSRTITLNGKVILRGAPTPGEISGGGAGGYIGTQSYLIPWNWDNDGTTFAATDKKMYHYNNQGGTTTWDLQEDWAKLANVKVYELTDNGRTAETIVPIVDGTITLMAKANTAYVVIKGESTKPALAFDLGLGMHLKDASFDSANITDYWTVSGKGSAARVMTNHQLPMLKLSGEVTVSQTLTDLIPGQQYAVYLGVDNRSDAKASMTIDVDGTIVASNFTLRSLAKNWVKSYHYNNNNGMESGGSYFQNMFVFFTAPTSGKVTLTLSRASGAGNTYFDDVRVVENAAQNITVDADGNMTKFSQDFENVAQGQYPFVVGPVSGLGDDHRQHLSEKHDPFTQAGWDVKRLDDVLSGNWSLKANGLTGANKILYQTIPQNIHFEPGVTYTVKFDYQMGSAGTYDLVYGSGEYAADKVTSVPLKKSLGTTATCVLTLVGDPSGQTWFGIRSTSQVPQFPTSDMSDAERNFGGYKDFVLDNLTVERSSAQKGELAALIATASGMKQADYSGDWAAFVAALTVARTTMANQKATQAQIDEAVTALNAAIAALKKLSGAISGTVTSGGAPVAGAVITLEKGADYIPVGRTATTGVDGTYKFEDLSLSVTDYKVKVVAAGYDVLTKSVGTLTNGVTTTTDVILTVQKAATYVNTFDTGDVSMIVGLEPADRTFTVEPIQYNGSGAMKIHFTGNRNTNNAVDKTLKMKNGTVSFDVTTLNSGVRFGADLRANANANRIQFGTFDDINKAGLEYWTPSNGYPSGTITGPGFATNVTRHVEYTMIDQRFIMKWDGVTVFDQTVTNAPSTAGFVGFSFGNSSGSSNDSFIIDNIRITPTDASASNTYTISGKVLGDESAPVANAQVTVLGTEDTVITRTSTGTNGIYTTAAVPAGTYKVVITAPSYVSQTVTATVTAAAAALADITLVVDVAQLQTLYDTVKDKTQDFYTEESWANFQAKLTQAKAALDAPKAVNVARAYNELNAAISALTEKPVDMSLLRTYYNSYNTYVSSGYTAESWAAFQTALKVAATVLNNAGAKQTQVDAACTALVNAEKALQRVGGGSTDGGSTGGTVTTHLITVTATAGGKITPTNTRVNDGGSRTFQMTADKDYVLTDLLLDGVSVSFQETSNGWTYTLTNVRAAHTLEAVFTLESEIIDPDTPLAGLPFTDVTNHWAASAIAFVAKAGLMTGTSATTFSAEGTATRATVATILHRMAGSPTTSATNQFSDVASGAWYAAAAGWASEQGIVTGLGNGIFAPNQDVTRQELITLFYRYAKFIGMDVTADGMALGEFSDQNDVADWAREAMLWAVQSGVITGKAGQKLDPSGTATRAELAVMLQRLEGLTKK